MAAPVFWRGPRTARVPMSMYAAHRAKLVAAMAASRDDGAPPGVALLQGGAQQSRHDTDHEELFRQARASGSRERSSWAAAADAARVLAPCVSVAPLGVVFCLPIRRG
jgi:hypothetical protein